MFLLTSQQNNSYGVLDTNDGVEEVISYNDLLQILASGEIIWGITYDDLVAGMPTRMCLRLYNEDGKAFDYDGVLLRDASPLDPDVQLLDWSLTDASEHFDKVVDLVCRHPCRTYNMDIHGLPVGYKVKAFSTKYLVLDDIETGESFYCNYYLCLYIYLVERRAIQGVEMSFTELRYDSVILTAYDCLLSYKIVNQNVRPKIDVGYSDDTVSAHWNNINLVFSNNAMMLVGNNIPIANLRYGMISLSQPVDWKIQKHTLKIADVGQNYVEFTNGYKEYDLEYIAVIAGMLENISDFILQIKGILKAYKAKCTLMGKLCTNFDHCFASSHIITSYGMSIIQHYYSDIKLQSIKTELGLITIEYNMEVNVVWLLRIANTGSAWYSMLSQRIETGTMSEFNKYCGLANDPFEEAIQDAQSNGLCWGDDLIAPLTISRIDILADGSICPYVVCITSSCKSKEEFGKTGLGLIEIPLLFCGGKFIEFENCYQYYTAVAVITLDKEIVHNLSGTMTGDLDSMPIYQNKALRNTKGIKLCSSIQGAVKRLAKGLV